MSRKPASSALPLRAPPASFRPSALSGWTPMGDRFLSEIRRAHETRAAIAAMDEAAAERMIADMGDRLAEHWTYNARDAQLPPPDLRLTPRCARSHGLDNAFPQVTRISLRHRSPPPIKESMHKVSFITICLGIPRFKSGENRFSRSELAADHHYANFNTSPRSITPVYDGLLTNLRSA